MYAGVTNPNGIVPLQKMQIVNLDKQPPEDHTFEVLYNPQSYVQHRSVKYARQHILGADSPLVQFKHGSGETLSFELFFDSLSAGDEVGGEDKDRQGFARNSRLTSKENTIDVRQYTGRIYELMATQSDIHRPPRLLVQWASLQFTGYLVDCEENFTKFDEDGRPVRAVLKCQFMACSDADKVNACSPKESPDTTKYRTVHQGDSLWALAAREYGSPAQWREIAAANGIANPRLLRSGDMLVLPALD